MRGVVGRGLTARTLVRRRARSLRVAPVRVGPVVETAQAGLLANLPRDVRENRVEAKELMVELVVRISDYVVLLVGRHHQIGQRAPDAIEEQPAILALLRLDGGILLPGRGIRKQSKPEKKRNIFLRFSSARKKTTHRWQRIIPDDSIHNGRGIGRTGDRFRVGRDGEQMEQILLERPRFGIDLLEQRIVAAELSRQGGDGIGEMGEGRVETVRDGGCLVGIGGRLTVEGGERAGGCLGGS